MGSSTRQAVIVLGMHRSGTSALAGALGLMGARLPVRLMPAGRGNFKGHFEPSHIVTIHDRVLAAAGTAWSGWDRIPIEWQQSPTCRPFVEELASAVLEDYGATGVFVVKDPRICRLIPLWLRVLDRIDVEASFAIVFRNPLEVAKSLLSRDGLLLSHGCLAWLRCVVDAERDTRGYHRVFLHYQDLIDDAQRSIGRVVTSLPLAWPRSVGDAAGEIQEFIDPSLRIQIADAKSIDETLHFAPWLRQASASYQALATNPDDPAAREEIDHLGATFDVADLAFTPLVKQEATKHAADVAWTQEANESSRAALQAKIEAVECDLSERDARIEWLARMVEERNAQIVALHCSLSEARADTAARDQALVARNAEISSLKNVVGRQEANLRRLQAMILTLRQSTSWRVTAPLRYVRRLSQVLQGDDAKPLLAVAMRIVRYRSFAPLRHWRAARIIARSDRFDRAWYLAEYPDVAATGIDPINHYVMNGAREGRNPGPWFNTRSYLAQNPDVTAAGINPLVHFIVHGADEGRSGVWEDGPVPGGNEGGAPAIRFESAGGVLAHLMAPTDAPFNDDGYYITRFMHYVWRLRPDLQSVFELANKESRLNFCKWFLLEASGEYELSTAAYPDPFLVKLAACGGRVAEKARAFLEEKKRVPVGRYAAAAVPPSADPDGANIVGYCRGEFGMGEFSRTIVRAFNAASLPSSVIDCPEGQIHGANDTSIEQWISEVQRFKINIININADILPSLYFRLGEGFFLDRFNIGYWAWELPKCPPEFDIALGMVDEVWALSDFAADSLRTRSTVPVFSMPLAVSVPVLSAAVHQEPFRLGRRQLSVPLHVRRRVVPWSQESDRRCASIQGGISSRDREGPVVAQDDERPGR
jgi:hypothetical protein